MPGLDKRQIAYRRGGETALGCADATIYTGQRPAGFSIHAAAHPDAGRAIVKRPKGE